MKFDPYWQMQNVSFWMSQTQYSFIIKICWSLTIFAAHKFYQWLKNFLAVPWQETASNLIFLTRLFLVFDRFLANGCWKNYGFTESLLISKKLANVTRRSLLKRRTNCIKRCKKENKGKHFLRFLSSGSSINDVTAKIDFLTPPPYVTFFP